MPPGEVTGVCRCWGGKSRVATVLTLQAHRFPLLGKSYEMRGRYAKSSVTSDTITSGNQTGS